MNTDQIPVVPVEGGFRVYCPYSGCGKEFVKTTEGGARQAVSMHVGRKHRRSITPPHTAQPRKAKTQSVSRPVQPNAYVRRAKTSEHTVNFCPNCSCDLRAVSLGMALKQA